MGAGRPKEGSPLRVVALGWGQEMAAGAGAVCGVGARPRARLLSALGVKRGVCGFRRVCCELPSES